MSQDASKKTSTAIDQKTQNLITTVWLLILTLALIVQLPATGCGYNPPPAPVVDENKDSTDIDDTVSPVDLEKKILVAYKALNEIDKDRSVDALVKVFKAGSRISESQSFDNVGRVFRYMNTLSDNSLLGDSKIMSVRKIVSDHLSAKLPSDSGERLTPEIRLLMKTEFDRIALALEAAKNAN